MPSEKVEDMYFWHLHSYLIYRPSQHSYFLTILDFQGIIILFPQPLDNLRVRLALKCIVQCRLQRAKGGQLRVGLVVAEDLDALLGSINFALQSLNSRHERGQPVSVLGIDLAGLLVQEHPHTIWVAVRGGHVQGGLVATIPDIDRPTLFDESLDLIGPVLPGSRQEGRLPALPGRHLGVRVGEVSPCPQSVVRAFRVSISLHFASVFTKATIEQFVEVSARCDRKIRQPKKYLT